MSYLEPARHAVDSIAATLHDMSVLTYPPPPSPSHRREFEAECQDYFIDASFAIFEAHKYLAEICKGGALPPEVAKALSGTLTEVIGRVLECRDFIREIEERTLDTDVDLLEVLARGGREFEAQYSPMLRAAGRQLETLLTLGESFLQCAAGERAGAAPANGSTSLPSPRDDGAPTPLEQITPEVGRAVHLAPGNISDHVPKGNTAQRKIEIIRHMGRQPCDSEVTAVSVRDLADPLKLNRGQVSGDMKYLVDEGICKVQGGGNISRYYLSKLGVELANYLKQKF